jgi:hypothetical protein
VAFFGACTWIAFGFGILGIPAAFSLKRWITGGSKRPVAAMACGLVSLMFVVFAVAYGVISVPLGLISGALGDEDPGWLFPAASAVGGPVTLAVGWFLGRYLFGRKGPKLFCPKCGKEAPDDEAFCPSCGVLQTRGSQKTSERSASEGGKVTDIVRGHSAQIRDGHIFFSPQIPLPKVRNAIRSFARGVAEQAVLVLVDNMIFTSGKQGGVLTEDAFYVRNASEKPHSVALADIHSVDFVEGIGTSYLRVNGVEFLQSNLPKKESMRRFAQMLRDASLALHPAETAKPAPEALREIETLREEGLLNYGE